MVLLVIIGIVLVLMETVMVSTSDLSTSVGGLLNPLNPNGICPKTHYRKPFYNGFNG